MCGPTWSFDEPPSLGTPGEGASRRRLGHLMGNTALQPSERGQQGVGTPSVGARASCFEARFALCYVSWGVPCCAVHMLLLRVPCSMPTYTKAFLSHY